MPSILQSNALPLTSEQVVEKILASGKITTAERLWFHSLTRSETPLTRAESAQIRLVLDRLQMGLLTVLD